MIQRRLVKSRGSRDLADQSLRCGYRYFALTLPSEASTDFLSATLSKGMPPSEKDRSARVVLKRWQDLQSALSDKRRYPVEPFKAFVEATRRYIELTKRDPLIHRSVAVAINGLTDFLQIERKRVPGDILREAERLECLFFAGYDPHFEGDEPPGL